MWCEIYFLARRRLIKRCNAVSCVAEEVDWAGEVSFVVLASCYERLGLFRTEAFSLVFSRWTARQEKKLRKKRGTGEEATGDKDTGEEAAGGAGEWVAPGVGDAAGGAR
ncbi:hypothetical protein DL771_007528 [Monosporascus sp. 5C6A]|nr:hypothetical protein DL771_007528 [Monosporascus sp. 5C6A]